MRDRPARVSGEAGRPEFGSDAVMDILRALGIEYVALLPGASFRGLHDSAVNYTGNRDPEIILVPHESVAPQIARGYTRVTGRPMAVFLHDVVGLLNASVALYDAWCDRAPMLVLAGSGPLDATQRRPWIDWIHTATDQAAFIRDIVKWDDAPASPAAAVESVLRGHRIAMTPPHGPVYVSLDLSVQNERIPAGFALPEVRRYAPPSPPGADAESLGRVADALVAARMPVAMTDTLGRSAEGTRALVTLAEMLAMPMLDPGIWGRNVPTPHPLDLTGMDAEVLDDADVVLALDMLDLGRALRPPAGTGPLAAASGRTVIHIGLDDLMHTGLTADYQMLPAVDIPVLAAANRALPPLVDAVRLRLTGAARTRVDERGRALEARKHALLSRQRATTSKALTVSGVTEVRLAVAIADALEGQDFVLCGGELRRLAPDRFVGAPDRDIGTLAGGVVGSSIAFAVGAALGLRRGGSLPVALVGDGDAVMSIQALWTAAHYTLPLLIVVANNRQYRNDELHQIRVARARGRPEENAWIGQRLEAPEIDLVGVARGFGVAAERVLTVDELTPMITRAIVTAQEGRTVLLDVRTEPRS